MANGDSQIFTKFLNYFLINVVYIIYIMYICIRNKNNDIMTPRFYILKEEGAEILRHFVTPEPEELRNAQNAMKWGIKKGTVSLIKPIRTSTTYWEV